MITTLDGQPPTVNDHTTTDTDNHWLQLPLEVRILVPRRNQGQEEKATKHEHKSQCGGNIHHNNARQPPDHLQEGLSTRKTNHAAACEPPKKT